MVTGLEKLLFFFRVLVERLVCQDCKVSREIGYAVVLCWRKVFVNTSWLNIINMFKEKRPK